jgi:5-methylcytosine-specific restriction endonuclease McrA
MPYIPKRQKRRPWVPERKPFEGFRARRDTTQHDTYRWEKASKSYLVRNPLCVYCLQQGTTTAAQHTDHIDHQAFDFWDQSGWQALCKPCHYRKSGQDGSLSRRRRRESPEGEGRL